MFTRMLILTLMFMLAMPVASLTPRAETSSSPWGEVAVEAKGKKQKQKGKKPKKKPVTRTIRQPVTRTFANPGVITIPAGAPGTTHGIAIPYPTAIEDNGFVNGMITDVNLTLHGVSHTAPVDLDLLLAPGQLPGQNAIVMSDLGGSDDATGITLTLDDQAGTELPLNGPLVSGTFRPTSLVGRPDDFLGQTPIGNSLLSLFNGGNPNGSWHLFVVDGLSGDTGQLAAGWSLQITAEADVQVQEKKARKDKKKGGGRKESGSGNLGTRPGSCTSR